MFQQRRLSADETARHTLNAIGEREPVDRDWPEFGSENDRFALAIQCK